MTVTPGAEVTGGEAGGGSSGPAQADPDSRGDRFMRSALTILAETGRTDFTVLEVVERSKTSLRSFYQHFATKDELMLALIDSIMNESIARWRTQTDGVPALRALQLLIEAICAPPGSTKQDSINRGLTFYNDHLAETRPREYSRVLSRLHGLIQEILSRGVVEGVFRADLNIGATAALIMQSALGAMRLRSLGAELNGVPIEAGHIYDFCVRGLLPDRAV